MFLLPARSLGGFKYYWKHDARIELRKRNFENENRIMALGEAGLDDRVILDSTLVVAYFNFVNHIIMALGVQLEEKPGEGYKY